MGIKDLSKLIADAAPFAIKENEIKNYFGRKVAIDASMSLYQFLIAVRSDGAQLTNADGETTSHLMGTFYRVSQYLTSYLRKFDSTTNFYCLDHTNDRKWHQTGLCL